MSSDLDVTWSYVGPIPFRGHNSSRVKTSIPLRGAPHPSSFYNSEGIEAKRDLNPPDLEVVQNALSSLIGGTKAANQDYLSNTEEDPAFDRDAKGRLSELIKVACQALIREADIESCDQRLQHDVEAAEYRQKRDNQLADTRYRQNALLPIHQFPVELFSNVLTFVVQGKNLQYYEIEHMLRQLARVAHHWKYAVLSTPQLWAYLHQGMSSAFIRISLHRSKTVPLDVFFYTDSYAHDMSQLGTFAESILPHSHRWRSLDGPYLAPRILEKLASHAPAFRHLRLVRSPVQGIQLGEGPHLQTLDLTSVSLSWDSNRISQLYQLSLTDLKGQHAPSLSQIMHILTNSPKLESLKLTYLEPLDTPTDGHIPVGNVDLPNLQSLEISELAWDPYNRLMGRFQFPFVACKKLRLEPIWRAGSDVSDTIDYLAGGFVQQVNCFAENASASISFELHTVKLHVDCPSKGRFDLRMIAKQEGCVEAYNDAVITLAQLVSSALPDTPLVLYSTYNTHPGFSVDLLMRFPSTTEIVLHRGGGCDIQSVVQFLGHQHSNESVGDNDLAWPCPKLKKLDICELSGHPVGDIRGWVKERWVKWKPPTNAATDGPSETPVKPDGLVEVSMPMKKSGRTEMWRPVQRTQNRKRVALRPKARVVYDDGEDDMGED
ncbi:hypothetical protein FRB93_010197 [Tulasnella sp. JGI-2019a]|nr:hypothetical protein FRB93_010197 [Tulasnella sp. JGI-2019a]